MKIASLLNEQWQILLKKELESEKTKSLEEFLESEMKTFKVFPSINNIFNAVNNVDFSNIKIVIIGQDPYHDEGQAHGYCFSVQNGAIPPSLQNIYKEIENEVGSVADKSGDLECWVKQGVVLLNTVLTVRAHSPNSHKGKGWEEITKKIVEILNGRDDPIVFMLWGNNAKEFLPILNRNKHLILTSAHPSPFSCHNGFFGNNHFKTANVFLSRVDKNKIIW